MIRVLLVDDHPVVREGVACALAAEPDVEIVGEAGTGREAIRLCTARGADVAVVDVRLPDMDGVTLCTKLRAETDRLRVVLHTSYPHQHTLLGAFKAGASGFVVKESDPSSLRTAVRVVAGGDTYIDPRVASRFVTLAANGARTKGPHGLSLQELRVLEQLPHGGSNREIAERLGVAPSTVKTHLHHAMRKLNARDRTEATALAIREGLA